MNAEELYEQGMRLLDDARDSGLAGYSASMANTYFMAAQARTAIDGMEVAMNAVNRASAPAQLPVTNFVPARDANGNNLYINHHGSILVTTGDVDPDEWTLLYGRVA